MSNLILTRKDGGFYTTSRIIASEIASVSNNSRDINRTIKSIIESYELAKSEIVGFKEEGASLLSPPFAYTLPNNNIEIRESYYISKQNKTIKMYELNRGAYMLILPYFNRYKKGREKYLQFIKAFEILELNYNGNSPHVKKFLSCGLPNADYGTTSTVNGMPRKEYVKGYYRSKNGLSDSELRLSIMILKLKETNKLLTEKVKTLNKPNS